MTVLDSVLDPAEIRNLSDGSVFNFCNLQIPRSRILFESNRRHQIRMFAPRPIGFASTSYTETSQIPKGPGAKHDADGVLKILPEFEPGLFDIEGFSHLYVIWEFDRSKDYDLVAHPPADNGRPHGVFATRSPRRPNPIALSTVELLRREGANLQIGRAHV